jgi:two-component sensor histidine kinase
MAGVLMIALIMVWAATHGLGRLGDSSVAFDQRVFAARVSLILVAFCGLVLTSLLTERRDAEAHIQWLMGEVNHRAKNLLAVVQGVAHHTAAEERASGFLDTFRDRISGLAASHDLLMQRNWSGAGIEALARSQLAHFENLIGDRISLSGPSLVLKAAATQAIGMALHELATNASKYGSLSNPGGRVDITWSNTPSFKMRWVESGGPPCTQPTQNGFGRGVLVDMARHQLQAAVRLDYEASGLTWELAAANERVLENGNSNGR